MPDGDEVYQTIAEAVPYLDYVGTAYSIIKAMYNFGKESDEERALRELKNRVSHLEELVTQLDERLSELEVRVAQTENKARLRSVREHQLAFNQLGRDLTSHPENAADIAFMALDRLRVMYEDDDLWLWSDLVRRRADAS